MAVDENKRARPGLRTGLGVTVGLLASISLARACPPVPAELVTDTRLAAGCVYSQSIRITRPLTLDCQGATFDGEGRLPRGLVIDSEGRALAGVTVRNCIFRRFAHTGILIHWSLPNTRKLADFPDLEARRQHAPQDILLQRLRVEQNGVMGVVVDDYVQRVTMDQVQVVDNPGWGIYWDHDSRGHVLQHSEVRHNGYGSARGKPGLSIDASSDNRVVDTLFADNARAAIELYRNCQEFAARQPQSIPREHGANRNHLIGNRFIDEKVGVWIASRQSRDIRAMACGRPYYHDGRYVEDEARENQVAQNRFERIRERGIVVEDDANEIVGNRFERGEQAIWVGTPIRSRVLAHPVRGTRLEGNLADDGQAVEHFTDAD